MRTIEDQAIVIANNITLSTIETELENAKIDALRDSREAESVKVLQRAIEISE